MIKRTASSNGSTDGEGGLYGRSHIFAGKVAINDFEDALAAIKLDQGLSAFSINLEAPSNSIGLVIRPDIQLAATGWASPALDRVGIG